MTDLQNIDSHTHFFPKKYVKALDTLGIHFGQTLDNRFTTIYPRLEDMEKVGISKQV